MGTLVERGGLFYEKLSYVPITGEVMGQHQGAIKDGMRDRPWVEYHDNGQLMFEGTWKDGILTPFWERRPRENGEAQPKKSEREQAQHLGMNWSGFQVSLTQLDRWTK
jgi:hypothetical protein